VYGNLISEAMEKENLTNEKLAVKAGVTSRTVMAIRKSKPGVNLKSLLKVSSALGLELDIRFIPKMALPEIAALTQ